MIAKNAKPLTAGELQTFLAIAGGASGIEDTVAEHRASLYRCRLIENKDRRSYAGHRVLTERGRVFLQMLQDTPLPIEVTTPRYVDPREPKCGYCKLRPAEHDGIGGPKCTECEDMLLG